MVLSSHEQSCLRSLLKYALNTSEALIDEHKSVLSKMLLDIDDFYIVVGNSDLHEMMFILDRIGYESSVVPHHLVEWSFNPSSAAHDKIIRSVLIARRKVVVSSDSITTGANDGNAANQERHDSYNPC